MRTTLTSNPERPEPFRLLTFDMGTPKVDLTKALALAAELEDEELLHGYERTGRVDS